MVFISIRYYHLLIKVNLNEVKLVSGIHKPLCAVSSAKFLTDGSWVDLRNPIDTDVPFRLFRDEGRTFLQVSVGSNRELKQEVAKEFLNLLICINLAPILI